MIRSKKAFIILLSCHALGVCCLFGDSSFHVIPKQAIRCYGQQKYEVNPIEEGKKKLQSLAPNVDFSGYSDEDFISAFECSNLSVTTETYSLGTFEEQGVSSSKNGANTLGMNTFVDDYMTITVFCGELGDAYYWFSSSAHWNKLPFNRCVDSLSLSADAISIVNSSKSGGFSYIEEVANSRTHEHTVTKKEKKYTPTTLVNGSWEGAVIQYNLPGDSLSGDGSYSTKVSSFSSYLSFKAIMKQPNVETYFNVAAEYDHTHIIWFSNPGFSWNIGAFSASIGMDWRAGAKDVRSIDFDYPFHYIPS